MITYSGDEADNLSQSAAWMRCGTSPARG